MRFWRILSVLAFVCVFTIALPAQELVSTHSISEHGYVTSKIQEVFIDPARLESWQGSIPPIVLYSPALVEKQQLINRNYAQGFMTYSPDKGEMLYEEIDREEITPFTWKWVDLKMVDTHDQFSEISLRRPTWWIAGNGMDTVGKKVFLDLNELAIHGWAQVEAIRANRIDTRFWDYPSQDGYSIQPITGKFKHKSGNLFQLLLDNGDTVNVTGNHPIYSVDRDDWIEVSSLETDEEIFSMSGKRRLVGKERLPGQHVVYNIEVYRGHNYFVSQSSVLAHNLCILAFSKASWIQLARQVGSDPMGNFKISWAAMKHNDSFDIYITNILRRKPKRDGDFTNVMEDLVNEARRSGAKDVMFYFKNVTNKNIENYLTKINEKWSGLDFTRKGNDIIVGGKLKDIDWVPQ